MNSESQTFGYGFVDGLFGTVTKPYEGAREGGWAGFGKGLGKGAMGLVTGPGAGLFLPLEYVPHMRDPQYKLLNDLIDNIETNFASIGMFGLFAYPFLGMYKSISTSSLSPSQRKILLARQVYGSYMARQREYAAQDGGQEWDEATQGIVLEAFERRVKRG